MFVHYSGKIELEYIDFEKSKQMLESLYLKQQKDRVRPGELKGQTGSPGIARGAVRIVKDIQEAEKFLSGNILVTGMTRAEFVPLMKKAAAIITDEGGITCHAAIVARELKKPCVIGTRVATMSLKDGDLVEVDANRGIVGVIKDL